jgi:hypothetical protein
MYRPGIWKLPRKFKVLLDAGRAEKTTDGWRLINSSNAPLILDDFLWGPPSAFLRTEIAVHRREAVVHILRHFPAGLLAAEIEYQLRSCRWVHAPVSGDGMKADIEALLSACLIRPRGDRGIQHRNFMRQTKWESMVP